MSKIGLAVVALALTMALSRAESPKAGALRAFSIGVPAVFGYQAWTLVSVEPAGEDVRVRAMRAQAVSESCPDVLVVRAAERVVRRSSVQAVAGVDICHISQGSIDRAFARSKTPREQYVDYMGSGRAIVTDCEGRQRVLSLSDSPPWTNFRTLHQKAPAVATLWELDETLTTGMLPDDYRATAASEALGIALLPELRSKAKVLFGDYLSNLLEGYTGPPALPRGPLPAKVLERDSLPLVTFVAPPIPPIALAARLTGDVRLRLTVNPDTGEVTQIDRLVDRPILGDAAVAAARSWKFDPARAPRVPVDVTVRFQIRCREN